MGADKRSLLLPLAIVFVLAFAIRAFPTVWSPYPYNIDGFGEVKMAEHIFLDGDLDFPADSGYSQGYIVDMPLFNLALAMSSQIIGIDPMVMAQLFVATIGALSCVLAALVAHALTDSRRASLLAGLLLAVLGTYVFCTSSVWKESLGLTMMVVIAGMCLLRKNLRMRIALTSLLVMMTFIHHHSAVVTYLFFTLAIAGEAFLDYRAKRWSWRNSADIVTAGSLWALVEFYYHDIDLPYYDFLSPDRDLYLLIALMGVVMVIMFYSLTKGTPKKSWEALRWVIPVIGGGLLVLNFVQPIFPGLPETQGAVILFAGAYLILFIPLWYGSRALVRSSEKGFVLLHALLLAPMTMILFALLRGLDPTSHMIIYRTFDFLGIGMAILFSAGALIIALRHRKLATPLICALLVVAASTVPIAFQTGSLFGVQNQTYEYEIDALEFIDVHSANQSISSDQRLGTVGHLMFNLSSGNSLALKIESGGAIDRHDWLLGKSSWTTIGAQEFPLRPRVIDNAIFQSFVSEQNVLMIGGPAEDQAIVMTMAV